MRALVLCAALTACATAPVRADPLLAPGEELIERGGELRLDAPPDATVRLEGSRLVAWGEAEVPGASRLQAALAIVDGRARARVLEALGLRITVLEQVQARASTAPDGGTSEAQAASSEIVETAKGLLQRLPLPEHAWIKVRRGGEVVLRLYARLTVDRAAIAAAMGEAPAEKALRNVEGPQKAR